MLTSNFLEKIKSFEGYEPKACWDYAQYTNGYGTKARFAGEIIDKNEAHRRFLTEISRASDLVESFAPGLSEGAKAALTSLTYNAGNAWTTGALGAAVARGDLVAARKLLLQYDKAGGKPLAGLTARREAEAGWIDTNIRPFVDKQSIRGVARADVDAFAATPEPVNGFLSTSFSEGKPRDQNESGHGAFDVSCRMHYLAQRLQELLLDIEERRVLTHSNGTSV